MNEGVWAPAQTHIYRRTSQSDQEKKKHAKIKLPITVVLPQREIYY